MSLLSAAFVVWQIRKQTNATKAAIFTSIIDAIHQDDGTQELLSLIYRRKLKMKTAGAGNAVRIYSDTDRKDLTRDLDRLLSRFQVLEHLFHLGVISKENLQTLKFEVTAAGRCPATRDYLEFLNSTFTASTRIEHDHFEYFKNLYFALETDKGHIETFRERCPSRSPVVASLKC